MKLDFKNWTLFGALQFVTAFLVGVVLIFVIGVWAESNVRHVFEEYGWDTVLDRVVRAMPEAFGFYGAWLAT